MVNGSANRSGTGESTRGASAPCLVTWNAKPGGPDATAKAGLLRFVLVQKQGTVTFLTPNCDVRDQNNSQPKDLKWQAQSVSFSAVSGSTYTVSVEYVVSPPGGPALARFQEDCSGARGGFDIDENTGPADYVIEVS